MHKKVRMEEQKKVNVFAICNSKQKENKMLKNISKEKMAHVSGAKWKLEEYLTTQEFQDTLGEAPDLDVLYMDVTKKHAIHTAEQFRGKNKEGVLMVIADETISPMEYIKPSVQASSLLLRPFEKEEAVKVVEETWEWYRERMVTPEECFCAEGIEEEIVVPYERVLYFECGNKTVYVNMEHQRIGFKGIFGELEKGLPSHFVRCHRSFIVNKEKIRDISYSKGEIYLKTKDIVPLSRSYKMAIRECGWKNERYYL